MIEIKNLSKEFYIGDKRQKILNNINLKIEEGEFITIMGPSGGGKSTLMQVLGLLTEPTEGKIYYDGKEINFKKEKELNRYRIENLGLVFQNANLISILTALENLIIGMSEKVSYKDKEKRAKELLNKVGISKNQNSNSLSLSGGEAQRVSVARALMNKPRVLLCDEPTGALDSKNSKRIIDLLLKIREERKCILIIVTHDKKIGELGDRKIYLEDGKLYEEVARSI